MSKRSKLELDPVIVETAFKCRLLTIEIKNNLGILDPVLFLNEIQKIFPNLIKQIKLFPCKVNATFIGNFIIPKGDENGEKDITEKIIYFNTKNEILYDLSDINQFYENSIAQKILTKLSEFSEAGSGWSLKEIIALHIKINKCTGFSAGACFRDLPDEIKNKKCCVNIQTNDGACFAWAITSALEPARDHVSRVTSYRHYSSVLNLEGITFPFSLNQLSKFESQNDLSVSIYTPKEIKKSNTFYVGKSVTVTNDSDFEISEDEGDVTAHDKKCKYEIVPIIVANNVKPRHVNLLLIQKLGKNDVILEHESIYHYCWIKNFSKLLQNNRLGVNRTKKFICHRCLSHFRSEEGLNNHIIDCSKHKSVKSVMPTEDQKYLYFKNYSHKERVPFALYCDLETIPIPISIARPSSQSSYTVACEKHVPYNIGYLLHCSYDKKLCKYRSRSGENCIDWFIQQLYDIASWFAEKIDDIVPMNMPTADEFKRYKESINCHMCEKPFSDTDIKAFDHCHLTGLFRGAAHQSCNLNYRVPNFIPVVFHNLTNFDSKFFIQKLCSDLEGPMFVLPYNKEKYKCFVKKLKCKIKKDNREYTRTIHLKFIDSINFLMFSLEKLASFLTTYPICEQMFTDSEKEHSNLLIKKGVFCYEWISFEKLKNTSLPEKDKFFNKLKNEAISDEDYTHAKNVWDKLKCQTILDYSNIYMKTDILLLADVFESFRDLCITTYKIDPIYYISTPSLSWSIMTYMTKVKIELFTDIDMLLFIEGGIRGGLSVCTHRHALANNKYMQNYDPSSTDTYLMYFDVNNLYGYAMSQTLPLCGFRWLTQSEINTLRGEIENISSDAPIGYILEVDLTYPPALHDLHSDLPFCPEHLPTKEGGKEKKLLATLYDKTKYPIHYVALQQCLRHGLKIKEIHRVLCFEQSAWMEPYISLNIRLRGLATNEHEVHFYKLLVNGCFGKSMQNVRKFRDVKLVSKYEGAYGVNFYVSKPNFKDRVIFDEDCVAIELNRCKIYFNQPMFIGFAVLDLSKVQLYKFHYEYMLKKYPLDNIKLCYTDTDSGIYKITTNDVYKDIKNDLTDWFDTSDYPVDNPYGFPKLNKKKMGVMKDELKGNIFEEFVGLRSKMYALRVHQLPSEKDKCVAKGTPKATIKKLTLDHYKKCLFSGDRLVEKQYSIGSSGQTVYTFEKNKIALDRSDDKRIISSCNIKTLPYGHYSLNK